jgi:hypothetical protein
MKVEEVLKKWQKMENMSEEEVEAYSQTRQFREEYQVIINDMAVYQKEQELIKKRNNNSESENI